LDADEDPVEPVGPEVVVPFVELLPDSAPEVEFDEVFTEPDWPPLPELPEVALGLAVALPVEVEPVEPVSPDLADEGAQLPHKVKHGETTMALPESPELPEFPESPEVAVPVELALPVFPESALPEVAVVVFPDVEVALPELPPVVVPFAVELPLLPEVAPDCWSDCAFPVLPEVAWLSEPWPFHWSEPWLFHWSEPAEPERPDWLSAWLDADAEPVFPVGPDVVTPSVELLPDKASDSELDWVSTEPVLPPLPELPDVALGLEVAFPEVVEPVEPVFPLCADFEPLLPGPWGDPPHWEPFGPWS
jgi:hypothetical protein